MYILLSMSVSQKDGQKQKQWKVRKSEGTLVKGVVFYILAKYHPYSTGPDEKVSQNVAEIENLLLLFAPPLF